MNKYVMGLVVFLTASTAFGTYLGNPVKVVGGGTGVTSVSALTAELDVFTSSLQGVCPASGGGSTNFLRSDGAWAAPAGSGGTVTSASVVSANGFAGSVATAATTPAITLDTTVTGVLKGNGTAISAATVGTDYLAPFGGTTSQYVRGNNTLATLDTSVVPENTNLYFTDARAIAAPLTGYVSGAGTVSATDSILQAIQKINGNVSGITSGINQLTGDATAGPGTGSQALTLATVNSNTGSFGDASHVASVTLNGKGLATAAASTSIQIAESQVTNLTTDLAAKQTTTLTNGNILVGNGSNVAASVTPSGDVTITNAGVTAIGTNKVTNGMRSQMSAHTFKGNNTGSTANEADLTATQLTAELNAMVGDSGSGGTKGLVPAPASGDAAAGKFLKADGTWAAPAGGGSSLAAWKGYHANNCVWSYSSTSYGDPADDASCTFTELQNNNFGTVTTYGSSKPGITFTPPKTGLYIIMATSQIYGSAQYVGQGMQLYDGTNVLSETYINEPSTSGSFISFTLIGMINVTSITSYSVRIRMRATTGTTNMGATGNTSSLEWTIFSLNP